MPVLHGEPELGRGGALRVVGRAVAARGARLLRCFGDDAFQFCIKADANHAPALGLDARPLAERGAVHGRVVRQLGRLDQSGPCLLLGDVAGVQRRAVRGVSAALGGGQHRKGVPLRPGRLVFLKQPGAHHAVHRAARDVRVRVVMFVADVLVRDGAIHPHVGDGIAVAVGAGAPGAGLRLARVVLPSMAGPLRAGPVLAARVAGVQAGRAFFPAGGLTWRAWSSRVLARLVSGRRVVPRRLRGRLGRRSLAPQNIGTVKHGDRLAADA